MQKKAVEAARKKCEDLVRSLDIAIRIERGEETRFLYIRNLPEHPLSVAKEEVLRLFLRFCKHVCIYESVSCASKKRRMAFLAQFDCVADAYNVYINCAYREVLGRMLCMSFLKKSEFEQMLGKTEQKAEEAPTKTLVLRNVSDMHAQFVEALEETEGFEDMRYLPSQNTLFIDFETAETAQAYFERLKDTSFCPENISSEYYDPSK